MEEVHRTRKGNDSSDKCHPQNLIIVQRNRYERCADSEANINRYMWLYVFQ